MYPRLGGRQQVIEKGPTAQVRPGRFEIGGAEFSRGGRENASFGWEAKAKIGFMSLYFVGNAWRKAYFWWYYPKHTKNVAKQRMRFIS